MKTYAVIDETNLDAAQTELSAVQALEAIGYEIELACDENDENGRWLVKSTVNTVAFSGREGEAKEIACEAFLERALGDNLFAFCTMPNMSNDVYVMRDSAVDAFYEVCESESHARQEDMAA